MNASPRRKMYIRTGKAFVGVAPNAVSLPKTSLCGSLQQDDH